jgi:SAM-dependent methyltransferase
LTADFRLDGVVPWGRTAGEYERFFALDLTAGPLRVLDCGGGPASFVADWGGRGHFAVAADPLYARSAADVAIAFDRAAGPMLEGMRAARHRFRWEIYGRPEAVVDLRRAALDAFLDDLGSTTPHGRYVASRLPTLPFAADSFDLVLCSHLLFLYSDEIDLNSHLMYIREMLRIAPEVRIFPLRGLDGGVSPHLGPVLDALGREAECELQPVPFEFQVGAVRMLRVLRSQR